MRKSLGGAVNYFQ